MAIVGTLLNAVTKNSFKGYLTDTLKLPQTMAKSAEEYFDLHPSNELFPTKTTLEEIKAEDVKEAMRIGYTKRREKELNTGLDQVLKVAEENKWDREKNAFEFIDLRIRTNSAALEESHKAFVGATESEIQKAGGKEALNIYRLAYSNPKKLKEAYGITNEQVFMALANPEYADNNVLRIIGKVYRKLDDDFVKRMDDVALMGDIGDHVVPMSPNPNVIESLGAQGLADTLTKYTLIDPDKALQIAKDYLKIATTFGPQRGKVSFPKRHLKFAEGREGVRNQFLFYKTINGLTDDNSGILERVMFHKEKVLQKAYFFKEFGMHPEEMINKLYQKLKLGADDKKIKKLTENQKRNLKTLDASMGRLPAEYGAVRYYADAANKFISAVYGAPQSLLRNLGVDNTMHPMSIRNAFINNQGAPGFFSKRLINPLVQTLSMGFQPKMRRGLNDILNVMDFAQTNNALFVTQGLRRENFFGDTLNLDPDIGYTEKIGRALNEMAGKLNYLTQTLAGNVAHYDATTAVNIVNSATAFSELILKSVDYDTFARNTGPLAERYLKWHFGIGKNEFLALKEAFQDISGQIPVSNVKKVLGFQDVRVLLPSMLEQMDDSIARKYRVKGETDRAFKQRLRVAYHSMLTHQRNLAQTGLYRANRVIEQKLERGGFIDLMLRPFTQFANIGHSQFYDGIRVGTAMSLYGSPYNTAYKDVFYNKKGMYYWTKTLGWYTMGAHMTAYMKDLLSGREPRAFTPKQSALLVAGSGVGGIPLSLFQQSFYSGTKGTGNFFGDAPLGDLISSAQRLITEMGDDDKTAYRLANFIQKSSGLGKLWWARGTINHLKMNAFLNEADRLSLERWYAEEMKSPFFGSQFQ